MLQAQAPDDGFHGLDRLAREAPNGEMRYLASIAASRFSQEGLAKIYAARFGKKIVGRNVAEHFMAQNPHDRTKKRYAEVLGVSAAALDLAGGRGLSLSDKAWFREKLFDELTSDQRYYPAGFDLISFVQDAFAREGPAIEAAAVEEYARGELSIDAPHGPFEQAGLARFFTFMRKHGDPYAMRQPLAANYGLLYDVELAVRSTLGEAHAYILVSAARAMLAVNGIDPSPYDEQYARASREISDLLARRHRSE